MDSETKFNEKKAAAPTETGDTRGDAGLATRTEAKPEGRATERSEGEGRNYRDGARPYHSSGATSSTGGHSPSGPHGERRFAGRRRFQMRRKVCRFCKNTATMSYRSPDELKRFVTERGKILPRRITGTCAKHQRQLALVIKRARVLTLLPFVAK